MKLCITDHVNRWRMHKRANSCLLPFCKAVELQNFLFLPQATSSIGSIGFSNKWPLFCYSCVTIQSFVHRYKNLKLLGRCPPISDIMVGSWQVFQQLIQTLYALKGSCKASILLQRAVLASAHLLKSKALGLSFTRLPSPSCIPGHVSFLTPNITCLCPVCHLSREYIISTSQERWYQPASCFPAFRHSIL